MKPASPKQNNLSIDRLFSIIALILISIAWIAGRFRPEVDLTPFLQQTFPEAQKFEPVSDLTYSVWQTTPEKKIIGYIALGEAQGYGGKLQVMVAVSANGTILNSTIINHKETFSFMRRVQNSDLQKSLIGKEYKEHFALKSDVNGVSGATYTSRAIVEAVHLASREIAADILKLPVSPRPPLEIQFGFPETVLMLLFLLTFITTRKWFKYRSLTRWIIMSMTLVIIGFLLNKPFTLIFVNKTLLGFFPPWQTHMFWYIMLFGILAFLILDNKNLYCERICPFGAAQEFIGAIGGAKPRQPANNNFREFFKWFQRGLALSVILIALIFTNPNIFSYEIFSALFHLIGSIFQFSLLAVILIFALFIKRPWCNYICPLRPFFDLIRLFRNWINEKWQQKHH